MNNYPTLGTFIVTLSLAHRLAMLASSRFIVPASRSYEMLSFNRRFCGMMRRLTAPHFLHVIDTYKLMDTLKGRAIELMVADQTKVVLNTCADMMAYTGAKGLAINRLYNSFGECIGYGPRPGFPSIDTQLDQLAGHLSGRKIILIEDGVFTGGTLEYVLGKLLERSHRISDVLIGFCKLDAEEALKKGLNGRVKSVYTLSGKVIDWLPSHDLVPFIPFSGRVLGCEGESGDYIPLTFGGLSHSYPYIQPFGMMGEWAGVSSKAAGEISHFGLIESIHLFECIEHMNGRKIYIRDLVKKRCVSLPLQIDKLFNPADVDTRVINYLREVLGIFEGK